MDDRRIIGPGDDDTVRLLNTFDLAVGSVMNVENGEATPVIHVDLASRSLASPKQIDERTYAITKGQAAAMAERLLQLVHTMS